MSHHAALQGVSITAQGLEQRFTPEAAEFMKILLDEVVNQTITTVTPRAIPVLQRFNGVYLRDSTVIRLPDELQAIWPGCGGSAGGTAALKAQIRLNYTTGQLDGPVLQAGREHDRRTPYGPSDEPAGSLSLSDLGYFSLDELGQRDAAGTYFITRYKHGTRLYTPEGEPLDLLAWLNGQNEPVLERQVLVGEKHRLPLRLIVFRVPQEIADQRRRRLREYARKKGVCPRKETLALAEWTILLTNVPETMLNREEALDIMGVRWQVEILFRVWKSHALVDEWRSQNPWRILCELYAKFIGQIITHWLLLLGWHRFVDLSLWKAAKMVQKLVLPLALAMQRSEEEMEQIIALLEQCFPACRQNKRREDPATFQRLQALAESLS